ncbi:TrwK protein [Leuconostoc gasicomitatum]|uniref:TrwK protein n=1 Tax=Leuconostoc gasicomitatum TaxID=115778 RepID=UPI001CC616E6|nr:TrwK protein [Leuconostoc gasicomitatum]MBZ5980066.1 TrwK protein [Leuconostoc gasicomitatum]
MVQDALDFYKPDKPDRNWERMQSRIEYLESDRSKKIDERDCAQERINEIDEELSELKLSIN